MGQNHSRSINNNKRRRSLIKVRDLIISEKYESNENKADIAEQYLTGECHDDDPSTSLKEEYLNKFSDKLNSDPKNRLALNAISGDDMSKILLNRETIIDDLHVYSEQIELEGKATNQKSSGRCWLFAATNVLRLIIMKKYKLDDFELSQPFLFFFDKLEKANYFLENMIELVNEDVDSRLIQYLIKSPVEDGGQWDMVINLLEKYGVVPKSVFPESYNSSNSARLNWLVTTKLREFAFQLRELNASGKDVNTLRNAKIMMMEEIYRIIAISLGEPPKEFDWTFRDGNGKYHSHKGLTSKSFYQDFIGYKATETYSLVNDPRNEYLRLYTVKYLGNIQGGLPIRYVNITMDVMKRLSIDTLRSGKPVWFGSDSGKGIHVPSGIFDNRIIDYELGFNIKFELTKAKRLQYAQSAMTHAMVLTGVHLDNDKPVRWRVENSWGDSRGDKGYFVMSDDWFSDWVYQIVLEKNDTPKELVDVLDQSPIVLPAWDPMGALAM
ncbi:putative cysteine proteinase 1, mitochondrial [Rhizophagus irregularis]|uniref:Cysteine proteinase 1, mitochondrial n=1 Tax=Rhizophagus irregularis TaxID=588596 RepID=A0A2I1G116_9GLOM|nr:putative cysteine proteinase 1, mitochondrial [Rhizophagus irregularis]